MPAGERIQADIFPHELVESRNREERDLVIISCKTVQLRQVTSAKLEYGTYLEYADIIVVRNVLPQIILQYDKYG